MSLQGYQRLEHECLAFVREWCGEQLWRERACAISMLAELRSLGMTALTWVPTLSARLSRLSALRREAKHIATAFRLVSIPVNVGVLVEIIDYKLTGRVYHLGLVIAAIVLTAIVKHLHFLIAIVEISIGIVEQAYQIKDPDEWPFLIRCYALAITLILHLVVIALALFG